MKKLLNKVEKATGIDLDGDGKVGDNNSGRYASGGSYMVQPGGYPTQGYAAHGQPMQGQRIPVQAMPVQARPVQAMPVQAVPVQAVPLQGRPVQQYQPPAGPAPPPAYSGLPPGWEQRTDATSGKVFYVDHNTKTTHWRLPAGIAAAAPPPQQPPPPQAYPGGGVMQGVVMQGQSTQQSAAGMASGGLPPGWEAQTDARSGQVYYIDRNTQTIHWSLPGAGAAAVAPSAPPMTSQGVVQATVIQPSAAHMAQQAHHAPGAFVAGGPLVQPSGRRKSLLIGCNYRGTRAELNGCINDVHHIRDLLMSAGFPGDPQHMLILTDDQGDPSRRPTKGNICQGMMWLSGGAAPGDVLFFHYSGHGGQQLDRSGAEEDGYDETILPTDYQRAGQITDDEIWNMLVKPLPNGARMTAIMDCCHSGTGLDLPYTYLRGQSHWVEDTNPAHSMGDVQMFSGCQDDQCSSDGDDMLFKTGGAMTNAFIRAYQQTQFPKYTDFMEALHRGLRQRGFKQKPQLSSSQPFDLRDKVFSLTEGIEPNRNLHVGRLMRKRKKPKRQGPSPFEMVAGVAMGAMLMDALF